MDPAYGSGAAGGDDAPASGAQPVLQPLPEHHGAGAILRAARCGDGGGDGSRRRRAAG